MKKLIIFSVIFSAFLVGCSNFNDIETVGINNSNNSEIFHCQFRFIILVINSFSFHIFANE